MIRVERQSMEFTPDQIHAFRHWIQGYPNFYEPIVEEYFRVAGYQVLRRPALVGRADIQRVTNTKQEIQQTFEQI